MGASNLSVVVLAKDTSVAKTRLSPDREHARRLALQLAERTVRTTMLATRTSATFVVTSDPAIAQVSAAAGAVVVDEERPLGINLAAALGRSEAVAAHPQSAVMILVADLPRLATRDLDAVAAEALARGEALFVPDHLGEGTTCLVHFPDRRLGIAFGRRSAEMHLRMGYKSAASAPPGIRRDMDTPEDLARWGMGVADFSSAPRHSIPS
jgi:2-phospho-L-lactate guanylyltransferase